jgi:hypothetical protein
MIGLAEQFSKSLVSKTGRTGDFAMNSAIVWSSDQTRRSPSGAPLPPFRGQLTKKRQDADFSLSF